MSLVSWFGQDASGQCARVSLPVYQQFQLNGMDRALEARDPGLACKFAMFTRLTRDDGPPGNERLGRGSSSLAGALRWTRTSAAIPILIVIALMAAIIALGMATSNGKACPSAVGARPYGQLKSGSCQPSVYRLPK